MPKVICTLPHASALINGVRFVTHKAGMISEDVGQDVADGFLRISGYVAADKKGQPAAVDAGSDAGHAGALQGDAAQGKSAA